MSSTLLMQAAQSAAAADGVSGGDATLQASSMMPPAPQTSNRAPASMPPVKPKKPALRRGKWTAEEEAYANRLIQEFKAGLLPLTDGTTLRTFLSKLLNCDPMRISKKFVGSNCIGKQVFRRRTADLNRLTPEQIQQSRAELSELERRFLERVAQTNRVKSNGVGPGASNASTMMPPVPMNHQSSGMGGVDGGGNMISMDSATSNPPWLQPPLGYKQGQGAAMAAAANAGNARAAAAGRALLGAGFGGGSQNSSSSKRSGNAGLLAMAELQRRASQQNFLGSAQNLSNLSNSALAQMARNASAARLGLGGGQNSISNLMLKTGFSREQLSQLAQERGMSSASLSGMLERQNSFDALMSLDFQSLQSIDNLANLIQTGGASGGGGRVPESGMKNAAFGNLGASSGNLSAQRLASSGRMESLLRSLSNNNVPGGNQASNANLSNLLGSMSQLQSNGNSMQNLLQQGAANPSSVASLAHLLRSENSGTGLSALRGQDNPNPQRNSSVEDFLSLMAAGDIPHQDPSLLNVPLNQFHQQQQQSSQSDATNAAMQQLLAQAASNPNLAASLASRMSFGNMGGNSGSAAALLAQSGSKRKLEDSAADGQGPAKK